MDGYRIENWHDFFVAQAGAGAALAGLVFVSISINLSRVLGNRAVHGRAVEALVLLGSLLVIGLAMLIPGQGTTVLGIELIVLGICVSAFLLRIGIGSERRGGATRGQYQFRLLIAQVTALSTVIGGATLLNGAGGGLYWLAFAAICAIVAGMIGAWVVLVEILR
jgi:hypothetical protein